MIISPDEINKKIGKVLLDVQKPGRYVGGEYNQIVKDWNSTAIHTALVFPDIYDIGLPNLGLAILYDEINKRKDSLAERVYSPWVDMENKMRENKIPIYSLESKHALCNFDIVGITIPYETLYTNVLNILDLGLIPIYSRNRRKNHPFIIVGGNSTFNPEPMAPFVDVFVIGDGEEIILFILDEFIKWKDMNETREMFLKRLLKYEGIYIPKFYKTSLGGFGKFTTITPQNKKAPFPIKECLVKSLPAPPINFIVPNINIIHNRISIEIMRGCTRGCRFCQAGMINRPVRERSIDQIMNAIRLSLKNTGFEEISLLSLSSSDYQEINKLIDEIKQEFCNRLPLSIALPSLRIDSFSVELMNSLVGTRHGSFTLAPEAANEKMRNQINKPISSKNLLEVAKQIYQRGWPTIKLYFMIGFPHETMEDIKDIVDLCNDVLAIGKKELGRRANLNLSINTFIPKPHTPFQWASLIDENNFNTKLTYLIKNLSHRGIKLNWSSYKSTQVESWLSRGDRKIASVIYSVWKSGAKFDAWQELFNYDLWINAFRINEIEPDQYISRFRFVDEILPWDHIDIGVKKEFLFKEYQKSEKEKITMDCRDHCGSCGVQESFMISCISKSNK
jgi:radical SAM family uncharacterized protein